MTYGQCDIIEAGIASSEFADLMKRAGAKRLDTIIQQTCTDAIAELRATAGVALDNASKTEGTWVVACGANDAANRSMKVEMTYKTASGVLKYTSTTTGVDATTETAFSPAVTDGYSVVSLTSAAAIATSLGVGPTGALTVATIAAGQTAATEATLSGVTTNGGLWVSADADAAAYYGKKVWGQYVTPWGEIKNFVGTIHGTNSTTEVTCFESSFSTPDTATTVTVRDFYRIRWARSNYAPATGAHYFVLGDHDAATQYAVIAGDDYCSIHTRYTAPKYKTTEHASSILSADNAQQTARATQNYGTSYIGRVAFHSGDATALVTIYLSYYPKGSSQIRNLSWQVKDTNQHAWDLGIALEPNTEVTWTIEDDNAAHPVVEFLCTYVEVAG
jgi:hypothetical protein